MNRNLCGLVVAAIVGLGTVATPAFAAATPAQAPAASQPTVTGQVVPAVHLAPKTCGKCDSLVSGSSSGNWSGYVKTGSNFSSISATWTVPTVSSTGSTNSASSTWVGIDGWSNSSLIQSGTEQDWNGSTKSASYYAWWEILPANETFGFSVSPGDNIVAYINKANATQWTIYLLDRNNGKTISQTESYSGPRTSAEFIQEATTENGSIAPLAHDSTVNFYNTRVNGNSPSLTSSEVVTMDQNSSQVSTPSGLNEAANGFSVKYGASAPSAPTTPAFQRHTNGAIYSSTGVACSSTGCPGWNELDNNSADVQIAAGAGSVFQRHSDGSIWEWTGAACTSVCDGWIELDNNAADIGIVAGSGSVYQLHSNGSIWRSTGSPCIGTSCPGWIELDNNPAAKAIAAGGGTVYQLHTNGSIWRSTGVACSGTSCPGWTELDNNPAAKAISANASTVYELHTNGSIWKSTGVACSSTGCPGWTELDNNPAATSISAGGSTVYQLHTNGSIWRSTGVACSGASCPGWTELDNNPAAKAIVASSSTVYELHTNGSIWKSTGVACSSTGCPGWTELDNNTATTAVTVSNGS